MATIISSGESSNGIIVENDSLTISFGGRATETVVNDQGGVRVYGSASTTTINEGGSVFVYKDGKASNTTVNAGGRMYVNSGGVASAVTINEKSFVDVSSGGTANGVNVAEGGSFCFAAAPDTAVQWTRGGSSFEMKNGIVSGFTWETGRIQVSSGGEANDAVLNSGGVIWVSSGGIADGATINASGRVVVSNGGIATGATVNEDGYLKIEGGTASTVTVKAGGLLSVSGGGKLTGQTTLESGAIVSAAEGAVINFDLTQSTGGADPLVTGLSLVKGDPTYTLTVDGSQAEGVYTLASGATGFAGTITVQNTYGADLGTLKLGEKLYIGKDDYTLTLTEDVLTVAINAPTVTNADGDVRLENTMPQARYMYGCAPTSIAMILGYYDLYGYRGMNFSALIEGDVELNARGSEEVKYTMNDFESNLGKATATMDYVQRFYSKDSLDVIITYKNTETTPAEELEYSFVDTEEGPVLRTDVWNCLADYLGTGQFWRMNENLSTTSIPLPLEVSLQDEEPKTIIDEATGTERTVLIRDVDVQCGVYRYVQDKGYSLDMKTTACHQIDAAGGDFTFEDYKKEIDAGRPVLVLIDGHVMVGYGYNDATKEIIFDNCYQADERMVWGGTYNYAEKDRSLYSIATIGLMAADDDTDLTISPFNEAAGVTEKLIVATAEDKLVSEDCCFVGSPLYLSFAVSNLGSTASGPFDASIYFDGELKENIPSITLDAETVTRLSNVPLAAEFDVGLHSISVKIDPDNEIPEVSALNNVEERPLMVLKEGTNVVDGTKVVTPEEVSKDDYLMNGAVLMVLNGGTAERTLIQGKVTSESITGETTFTPGTLNVSQGGLVKDATIYEYGQLLLSGTAENTSVLEDGIAVICSGGVASDTSVAGEGKLTVKSGGKVTGQVQLEDEAKVTFEDGAILDFDLTGATAGTAAPVNDLSIIQGTPLYTLTVNGTEVEGVYSLADGAAGFAGTISVVNTAGDALGSLTIGGEAVSVDNVSYTLGLVNSTLSVTVEESVVPPPPVPTNLVGTKDKVSWESEVPGPYVVVFSTDNFDHMLQVSTDTSATDILNLPAGTYQWRVEVSERTAWTVGEPIVAEQGPNAPKVLQSNGDGNKDLFFATANGTWSKSYLARHTGSYNDWAGTNDRVCANGRNRLADLFFGSNDASILCLTDDTNGDGIFLDDEFTDLPESIAKQQARIAQIDEIRAGAGNDIVDMTSSKYEYIGSGMTIRGGDGNDVIWANKGSNFLFGDAGNDRIAGASGNDVIVGGIGSDRMHGGGGNDVFTFCDNWGTDTVQQLETGTVTLWFASGSETNWNVETLTYTDGGNSVTVKGVTADKITLKFGSGDTPEDAAMYTSLASAGAFDAFTSQKIFEESGILASV